MFRVGMGELVVIFLAIFILFGPKALPDIARELGELVKNFKKSMKELNEEISSNDETTKK